MSKRWFPILIGILLAHAATLESGRVLAACEPLVVANGPEHTASWIGPLLGKAEGQTFRADGTAIDSILVWVYAKNYSGVGMHLIVVETDSTGRPDPRRILGDHAPVVSNELHPDSSSLVVRFGFDPPVQLPSTGTYAFFVQGENCFQGVPWYVSLSNQDDYADGQLYQSGRAQVACQVYSPMPIGGRDIIFRVVLCKDSGTASKRSTWGRLKRIYR